MFFNLLLKQTQYSPLLFSILYNVNVSMRPMNEVLLRTVRPYRGYNTYIFPLSSMCCGLPNKANSKLYALQSAV